MTNELPSRSFRPGACQRCGGDAFLDKSGEFEWRCLQCGRPLIPYFSEQGDSHITAALEHLESAMAEGTSVIEGVTH
jgi:predicted  nucleic acid-binding Zn-ribbon protein